MISVADPKFFISVSDRIRIRPKVSDPYGPGFGSGSATLIMIRGKKLSNLHFFLVAYWLIFSPNQPFMLGGWGVHMAGGEDAQGGGGVGGTPLCRTTMLWSSVLLLRIRDVYSDTRYGIIINSRKQPSRPWGMCLDPGVPLCRGVTSTTLRKGNS
jgi:hypothetical protein